MNLSAVCLSTTPVFTAALVTVAKTGAHAVCPCRDEWTKTVWNRYATGHFSAISKSGMMPFTAIWIGTEIVILSE